MSQATETISFKLPAAIPASVVVSMRNKTRDLSMPTYDNEDRKVIFTATGKPGGPNDTVNRTFHITEKGKRPAATLFLGHIQVHEKQLEISLSA